MKGDKCGFLHQFDKERMPTCRYFAKYGECKEPDCPYKHSNDDVKECNMYKLGFCIHGPNCRYKHIRLDGPPPPPNEGVFDWETGTYSRRVAVRGEAKTETNTRGERETVVDCERGAAEGGAGASDRGATTTGPPPKKARTVDVNLALPEAQK